MGWFYGFKLHMVINDSGEILGFTFTPANISDVDTKSVLQITKDITGKLFGDKGYISKRLFELLYERGITLITKIRKNMKNKLLPLIDKILLRKMAIIETVNDELKNIYNLEHTRHRSPINAMVNWLGALIAYTYRQKKPSLKINSLEGEVLVA
jgi:IS5 family transposase